MLSSSDTDNVIAALGRSNRVHQVSFWQLAGRQLQKVLGPMQVSFPKLRHLYFISHDTTPPTIPDSFLSGSAPRLRILQLNFIIFPGLPKLLLSATQLTYLHLVDIPHAGYISPESMVALLSMLSNLETLTLDF